MSICSTLQNPGFLFVISMVYCARNSKAQLSVSSSTSHQKQRALLRVVRAGLNKRWGAASDVCFRDGYIHWFMHGAYNELRAQCVDLADGRLGGTRRPAHQNFITSCLPHCVIYTESSYFQHSWFLVWTELRKTSCPGAVIKCHSVASFAKSRKKMSLMN